ncbi:MAG: hypothetical protein CMF61_08260 [Magnetococcales bacterium]|nr:hypothetical protein [Magnetococcales bacterium]
MKKFLIYFLIFLAQVQSSHANPLLHVFGHKKAHEIKFVLETFGPATVKCYYRVTRGADLTLERFEKALKSGYIAECLQQTAAEHAEYLQRFAGGVHQ